MDLRHTTSPQQVRSFTTPATASFASQTPTVTSPGSSVVPNRPTTSSFFGITRNAPITAASSDEDLTRVDPDDLFRRFTVAQVKSLAVRFRAEADAKQEELRLMVGERYRDLLQASTSIIDMASSSGQVAESLHNMSAICSEQTLQKAPVVTKNSSENDSQLKSLQTLAAHLKLLLDSPEHFWKLVEKKKYLDATWLFLVARMVHRSLLEDEDEDVWVSRGIDVLEQFPLVQRQWDAISGFQAQISHKATQALRQEMNVQETSDAVISLILLDSLSIESTLSTYLSQRGKAVQTFLSSAQVYSRRLSQTKGLNGIRVSERGHEPAGKVDDRKKPRDARQALQRAIDLLAGTLHIARALYSHHDSNTSLIERRLMGMQNEGSGELSTQQVLSGLPSSSLLSLYLPASIKSYAPYIDSSSASFQLADSVLSSQLSKWFQSNLDDLSIKIKEWINVLDSAADVDRLRSTAAKTSLQRLNKQERTTLVTCVDRECGSRITELWKEAFVNLSQEFETSLLRGINHVRNADPSAKLDLDPVGSLLSSSLPYPPISRSNIAQSSIDAQFSKFDVSLRQRQTNRTPLLDSVVSTLEKRAAELKGDLNSIATSDDSAKAALSSQFTALVGQLCAELVACLQRELSGVTNSEDDGSTNATIFIGRVASTLSVSSPFFNDMSENSGSGKDFTKSMTQIHERSISLWRVRAVKQLVPLLSTIFKPVRGTDNSSVADMPISTRPSPGLLEALLSLISSVFKLGLSRPQLESNSVIGDALKQLVTRCLSLVDSDSLTQSKATSQLIWDITFLEQVCKEAALDISFEQVKSKLKHRLDHLIGSKSAQKVLTKTLEAVLEDIPRLQVLLSPLLNGGGVSKTTNNPPSSPLLLRGTPSAENSSRPTIDLAQPSPRFGLLLVARSTRPTTR